MKSPFFFFFFLFGIILTSYLVSAEIELTVPFSVEYDIKRPCINNGTYCSASATCNLTLTYPNGNNLFDNRQMTNQLAFHNITVNKSANNRLGVFHAGMTCSDPGGDVSGNGFDTFEIEVTGDGNAFNVFPIQIALLILGVVFILAGKTREDLRLMKHMGAMIVLVLGVVTLFPGYSFLNHSNIQGQVIGFSSIGMGFYFLVEDFFSRDRQVETFDQNDDGRNHDI